MALLCHLRREHLVDFVSDETQDLFWLDLPGGERHVSVVERRRLAHVKVWAVMRRIIRVQFVPEHPALIRGEMLTILPAQQTLVVDELGLILHDPHAHFEEQPAIMLKPDAVGVIPRIGEVDEIELFDTATYQCRSRANLKVVSQDAVQGINSALYDCGPGRGAAVSPHR